MHLLLQAIILRVVHSQDSDIDLVYLWVDGSDPIWKKKKEDAIGLKDDHTELNNVGRYKDNHELKYSLRSAEKYVPWIRKIFIVTDNQIPAWLKTDHPKIQVVDHTEIMPAKALPCFNSTVIESFLHKIPGLSNLFLYGNDDTFFNKPLTEDFFFSEDNFPIVRLKRKLLGRWHYPITLIFRKRLGQYADSILNAARLVKEKTGIFYAGVPHHNFDPYLRQDYQIASSQVFKEEVEGSLCHRVRTYGDISRHAFGLYALATHRAHLKYVGRKKSLRIRIYKHRDYGAFLKRYSPLFFCMNDSQRADDEDRSRVKTFLERYFPQKSSFEQ